MADLESASVERRKVALEVYEDAKRYGWLNRLSHLHIQEVEAYYAKTRISVTFTYRGLRRVQ